MHYKVELSRDWSQYLALNEIFVAIFLQIYQNVAGCFETFAYGMVSLTSEQIDSS